MKNSRLLSAVCALALITAACAETGTDETTTSEPGTSPTEQETTTTEEETTTSIDFSVGFPWQGPDLPQGSSIEPALDALEHDNGQSYQVQCEDCGTEAIPSLAEEEQVASACPSHPTYYTPTELIAQRIPFNEAATEAGFAFEDITPTISAGQDVTYNFPAGLGLFDVFQDPISAIETLNLDPGVAAPNYVYLPAPAWKFSPADDRVGADANAVISSEEAFEGGTVVVIDDFGSGHGQMVVSIVDQLLDDEAHIVDMEAFLDPNTAATPVDGGQIDYQWTLPNDATLAAQITAAGTVEFDGNMVINLSLGTYPCGDYFPLLVRNAIESLPNGVQVVAAAGNDGHGEGEPLFFPAGFDDLLSTDDNVVTSVGALARVPAESKWVIADFSNRQGIDKWAPGVAVVGHDGDEYVAWSGTSFAAPHVSACMAALEC